MKDAKERESERDRKTDTEKDRVQESDRGLSRQKDKGNRNCEFNQRSWAHRTYRSDITTGHSKTAPKCVSRLPEGHEDWS